MNALSLLVWLAVLGWGVLQATDNRAVLKVKHQRQLASMGVHTPPF